MQLSGTSSCSEVSILVNADGRSIHLMSMSYEVEGGSQLTPVGFKPSDCSHYYPTYRHSHLQTDTNLPRQ